MPPSRASFAGVAGRPPRQMKLLDLFSGFGGVSVAAQASGLQIVEGVDADAHAAAAFAQNFPLARAKRGN